MLRWEGVIPNAEAPLPPQYPAIVTTSLERDLESCWVSIAYATGNRRNNDEKLDFYVVLLYQHIPG